MLSYKIFLNQNGMFCLASELMRDNGIDTVLKDLFKSYSYDIR